MPSGLQIITSNHLEVLAAGLAGLLRQPAGGTLNNPLHPEWVMVQSKGMQRWVSMAVARSNGVCANIAFPFPNALLERLYNLLPGPAAECHGYDAPSLTFRILHLLPELLHQPSFASLQNYLSKSPRPLKRYQLARKLADTLDQYVIFRPEMVLAWESGRQIAKESPEWSEAWQADLWRCLVKGIAGTHRARMRKELIRNLINTREPLPNLPPRVSVFGISYLPPFHLQVLQALAQRIPVVLFLLNPCRGYWFDIVSGPRMSRRRHGDGVTQSNLEMLHLEQGNRLLASLGHQGRHFFDAVHQGITDVAEAFRDNPEETLLGQIQQDILDLNDRTVSHTGPDGRVAAFDGSVCIHSCHSPMREVEVLYDQLLAMLARHHRLEPRDILVMMPDINGYAPYIHAVFGAAQGSGAKRIPYTVADQRLLTESPVVNRFVQLLDMAGSRFEASRILTLLECPAIHRRFGLCDADLPLVEKWVRETGIRWGWDGMDRRRHQLPGFWENTWRIGLDRMVLGYALAGGQNRFFSGILPYEGIGAGEEGIAGKLVHFAESLYETMVEVPSQDTMSGWHRRLHLWIESFFETDQATTREREALHAAIDPFVRIPGNEEQRLTFEVVRRHIKDALGRMVYDHGFMAGGITFCAMLPMRSIPAEVICLLGMNHDTFPRQQHEPGFNLITLAPEKGDRSRRGDDRYLFLETVISARQTLYLSYVGQDLRDNSAIPPSVVVDELAEYVSEGFGIHRDRLVTRHPLHGFSPAYFNGSHRALFSYCEENQAAAAQLAEGPQPPRFIDDPLPPPPDHWRQCHLSQLIAFFVHPTRFFMENRLGLQMRTTSEIVEDRERFGLDSLARYQLHQQLFQNLLKGMPSQAAYDAARAAGALPHGVVGKVLHQSLNREARQFIRAVRSYLPEGESCTRHVAIDLPPFVLNGPIDGIYPNARVAIRIGSERPSDLLQTFILHLAMTADAGQELPETSFLVCREAVWRWDAISSQAARQMLEKSLALFWDGLRKPLPFFCRTSFAYADYVLNRRQPAAVALTAARKQWLGNDYAAGEGMDPYHGRCFDTQVPLTPQFERLARTIFGPVFSGRRKTIINT